MTDLSELLTIDFETDAITVNPVWQPPKPCGVSIKWGAGPSKYFAWGHPTENNCDEPTGRRELMHALKQAKGEFIAQNAGFEVAILREYYGWVPKDPLKIHDVMIVLFLTDPYAQSLALKPSAERVLGLAPDEQTDLRDWILANVPGAKASDWGAYISKAPGGLVGKYACGDTDREYLLFQHLYPKVLQAGMLEAYRREQKLLPVLNASAVRGVRIDVDTLGRDIQLYLGAKKVAEDYIFSTLGEFDLNKDAQLAAALDAKGLITDWVLTPTGKRSVARKNLTGRVKDPLLLDYLAYHGVMTTCLGTFAGPWLAQALKEGGRVHPQWNQVRGDRGSDGSIDGTRTGRMSCIARGEGVLTKRGEVPIEDVLVGDCVLTHAGRWRAVVATIANGQRPVFKYSLSNGKSVVCTDDHKFFTGCDWLPMSEIADGSLKSVDGGAGECCAGASDLPRHDAACTDALACTGVEHDGAQRSGSAQATANRGEAYSAGHAPRGGEAGGPEPHVWQDNGETPQLHRRLRGWHGLHDSASGRAAIVDPQTCDGGDAGTTARNTTHESGCAPHRRQPSEQRAEQLSSLHSGGAPANPRAHGRSQLGDVEVTAVQFIGVREVFDLTVAEDHSFGIAGVFAHNCKAPNLQNPPTDFESLKIPVAITQLLNKARENEDWEGPDIPHMRRYLLPEEGHKWLKRDFSAQEMRILAHFAEGKLYDAFRADPKTDPHDTVKKIIDGLIGGDMPRKYVKITGFGIMYGRGVKNLSLALGVDEDEGKRVRDAYYAALPEVQDLSFDTRNRGKRGQFIRTWGGRVYYREPNLDRDLSYKLLNYLIQGSAADQTKQAMVDWDAIREPNDTLIAAVHDEVNISAPIEDAGPAMVRLRTAMDAERFDVPFMSEGYIGDNWANIEKYEPS